MRSFIDMFEDLLILRTLRGVRGLMVLALLGGCARSPSVEANPDAGNAPVITRLEPTSGPAGEDYPIDLTIYGSGFAEADNVVHFGSVTISNRPSTNAGTQITVAVPKIIESSGEVPPFVIQPGEYPITVTTARGTSEPVMFRLTREFEGSSNR